MTSAAGNVHGVIKVKLIRAGKVLREYNIQSESFTIGSGKACTIRAGGDPGMAEKHATVYLDGNDGSLTIVPEPDATVYLNDEAIDVAVPTPDDVIKIGRMMLQVEVVRPPQRDLPPALKPSPSSPRMTAIPFVKVGPFEPPADRRTKAEPSVIAAPPPVRRSIFSVPAVSIEPEPAFMDPDPVFGSDDSMLAELPWSDDSILTEIRASDDPIFAQARRLDELVDGLISEGAHLLPATRRNTPSEVIFSLPDEVMAADADADAYYSYDDEDEETFKVPFDLASQLLATKRTSAAVGPREPYCAAHVIRVVHGHVVEAFGVVSKRPYTTIDAEVHCRIAADKGGAHGRVLLKTGHGVTGQVFIDGSLHDLQSLTVIGRVQTIALRDGDSAKLQGAGGDYKIEVYRPPLAPRKVPLSTRSLPMIAIALGLALAFHGVAAYGLGYLHLDGVGDWSKEEKARFTDVTLDRREQKLSAQPAQEETPAEEAMTIAERAFNIPQADIPFGMSAGVTVGESLDRAEVLRVVSSHKHAIRVCYESAEMTGSAMNGRLVFDWTVTATGAVRGVRVRSSPAESLRVVRCISEEIAHWRFPKPNGGEATITVPFSFRSGLK